VCDTSEVCVCEDARNRSEGPGARCEAGRQRCKRRGIFVCNLSSLICVCGHLCVYLTRSRNKTHHKKQNAPHTHT
jgi:hypothetical protein